MRLFTAGAALTAVAAALAVAAPALAQESAEATVTRVIDGDTLEAETAFGTATVRLVGIDAPALDPPECAGREAAEELATLVEGRRVVLTTDPSQGRTDAEGRVLAYVDVEALDAGHELVRRGWADVHLFDNRPFARQPAYEQATAEASDRGRGAWGLCGGAFHEPLGTARAQQLADSAERSVRNYYSLLSRRRFAAAWRRLSAGLRRRLGPYRSWRAGYARSLGTRVTYASARVRGSTATVRVRIRARDRDACNGRVVSQRFAGSWTLVRRGGRWIATRIRMRKTGGGRVRVFRSQCPAPRPRSRPRRRPRERDGSGCHPSYPDFCIPPPPPDLDCSEVGGEDFTVRGSDPHGFDRDGDGVGCES